MKKETIRKFKDDLYKDQRKLELTKYNGIEAIEKFYLDNQEQEIELEIIEQISEINDEIVPKVFRCNDKSVCMKYYEGIRVFNFLVVIDNLDFIQQSQKEYIKDLILKKSEKQQIQIQNVLLRWGKKRDDLEPYPQHKIVSIIEILADCLDIQYEKDAIINEVDYINNYWNSVVEIPFRDATTKNMLIYNKKLNYDSYNDGMWNEYIKETILKNEIDEWINSPIIDFDFSSCIHNTTFEDDVISLMYHERTWKGRTPIDSDLVWIGAPNGKRAAITFLVRYFRFGGRKAAYRLIHPTGHRIRFKHDDDTFYFNNLPSIMTNLWPDARRCLPNIIKFVETVARQLKNKDTNIDLFLAEGYKNKQPYYTNIYPN